MYTTYWDKLSKDVSRLGFGIMRMPNNDGVLDKEKCFELIDYALANGINYIDTAYMYHGGESESLVGEVLAKYPRESYTLASKLPLWEVDSFEKCEELLNIQLAKCRVDYFDMYLAHSLNGPMWKKMKNLGMLDFFRNAKKQGKCKLIGFSYHGTVEDFFPIMDAFEWDFVQIQINYVDNTMQNAELLYQRICQANIPCVVMEPLRGGGLSILPPAAQDVLDAFDGEKTTPAQLAFKWCLDNDNMKIVLSGMNTMEQLKDNINTFSTAQKLNEKEQALIATVKEKILESKTVPCTSCNYCDVCPSKVAIPEVFNIYNQFNLFKNKLHTKTNYKRLVSMGQDVSQCTFCGECVKMCPQSIQIPELLRVAADEIDALVL